MSNCPHPVEQWWGHRARALRFNELVSEQNPNHFVIWRFSSFWWSLVVFVDSSFLLFCRFRWFLKMNQCNESEQWCTSYLLPSTRMEHDRWRGQVLRRNRADRTLLFVWNMINPHSVLLERILSTGTNRCCHPDSLVMLDFVAADPRGNWRFHKWCFWTRSLPGPVGPVMVSLLAMCLLVMECALLDPQMDYPFWYSLLICVCLEAADCLAKELNVEVLLCFLQKNRCFEA